MIRFEVLERVCFTEIAKMDLLAIPPIGTHLIIQSREYIIENYILCSNDICNYKMVVKKTNNNDVEYKEKLESRG